MLRTLKSTAIVATTALIANAALADSNAAFNAAPSSSMVLSVQLTITTALGTSSDSDVKTVAVTGSGLADLFGADPAWTSATFTALHIDPADATFHFDLYCFPFIGCQALDVALTGLMIDLTAPATSSIGAGGSASFVNAPVLMQGNYTATGVANATGAIFNDTTATIGCRILAQPSNLVRIDQMTMSPVVSVIDPASLPAGVTALTVTVTPNLANVVMSGPYTVINRFDLDGDGLVGASDLTIVLGQWGGPGTADFSGNGIVDAADLTALLGQWG